MQADAKLMETHYGGAGGNPPLDLDNDAWEILLNTECGAVIDLLRSKAEEIGDEEDTA